MNEEESKKLDERVDRAVENFMAGYGCCQSVVAAFADLYGLDDTLAKKMAAGFGGGVGRMRMMCGAVSGIVMLTGLDCGQTEGSDSEGKSACYKVVQELLAKSKEENGSLICAEILGLKGYEKAPSSYVASERTAEYYKQRPCVAKVESAARLFANYLKEKYYHSPPTPHLSEELGVRSYELGVRSYPHSKELLTQKNS
jgi:C_GCAxxG_C_C family probable redox protein